MAAKYTAFSIDAILASECSRSPDKVEGDHAAVTGDGGFASSNLMSVDDVVLRRLLTDVAYRLLSVSTVTNTSLWNPGIESNTETEQYTNNIQSNNTHWQRLTGFVRSWLEQRPRSIHSPTFDSRVSASPERRTPDGLHVTNVNHSGRERRQAEFSVVDGRSRPQSPSRSDVDAVNYYFNKELKIEADGGSRAAWLTGFHGGQRGGSRETNLPSLMLSDRSTIGNQVFGAPQTDSTLLWSITQPFAGN